MFNYLAAYRNNRTVANATRLVNYLDKHPLAVWVATEEDIAAVTEARKLLGR